MCLRERERGDDDVIATVATKGRHSKPEERNLLLEHGAERELREQRADPLVQRLTTHPERGSLSAGRRARGDGEGRDGCWGAHLASVLAHDLIEESIRAPHHLRTKPGRPAPWSGEKKEPQHRKGAAARTRGGGTSSPWLPGGAGGASD